MASDGTFMRSDSVWRSWVKKDSPTFPPEKDRYHLYVAGEWEDLSTSISSKHDGFIEALFSKAFL